MSRCKFTHRFFQHAAIAVIFLWPLFYLFLLLARGQNTAQILQIYSTLIIVAVVRYHRAPSFFRDSSFFTVAWSGYTWWPNTYRTPAGRAASCFLAIAYFAAPEMARAEVTICNRGEVDLQATKLRVGEGRSASWELKGWYTIKEGECTTINFRAGFTNIVFGLSAPDGRTGIVKYEPVQSALSDKYKLKEICVTPGQMDDEGSFGEPYNKYLPPCSPGYKVASTSATVYIHGDARMTLNIKPTLHDYTGFLTSFSVDEVNAPPSPRPPPRPAPPEPRTYPRISDMDKACRRGLGIQGFGTEDPRRLSNYCRCMARLVAAANMSEDVQDQLVKDFSGSTWRQIAEDEPGLARMSRNAECWLKAHSIR